MPGGGVCFWPPLPGLEHNPSGLLYFSVRDALACWQDHGREKYSAVINSMPACAFSSAIEEQGLLLSIIQLSLTSPSLQSI